MDPNSQGKDLIILQLQIFLGFFIGQTDTQRRSDHALLSPQTVHYIWNIPSLIYSELHVPIYYGGCFGYIRYNL